MRSHQDEISTQHDKRENRPGPSLGVDVDDKKLIKYREGDFEWITLDKRQGNITEKLFVRLIFSRVTFHSKDTRVGELILS